MKELEYPFDPEYIIKKKKSLKKQFLADENTKYIDKKIAVLGGETTENIKLVLELFLLNYGIRPDFMSLNIINTMRMVCFQTRSWKSLSLTLFMYALA